MVEKEEGGVETLPRVEVSFEERVKTVLNSKLLPFARVKVKNGVEVVEFTRLS